MKSPTQNDSFIQAILTSPEDDAPLLMFADYCREQGEGCFADALVWMVRMKARPTNKAPLYVVECLMAFHSERYDAPIQWVWVQSNELDSVYLRRAARRKKLSHILPRGVVEGPALGLTEGTCDEVTAYSGWYIGFTEWHWAVWWLALRLRAMKMLLGQEVGPAPVLPRVGRRKKKVQEKVGWNRTESFGTSVQENLSSPWTTRVECARCRAMQHPQNVVFDPSWSAPLCTFCFAEVREHHGQ